MSRLNIYAVSWQLPNGGERCLPDEGSSWDGDRATHYGVDIVTARSMLVASQAVREARPLATNVQAKLLREA